ncbi:DUF7452 domain-containing protein [Cerasicoccus maritimus]|uniref:DUF7452 domain-containing protein n=1 Tax=Cerasicoccus maritimus TaxID=490089 RepID=UPI0028526037|nr:hypothetical protein [Cerasicoccus maritimus]
MKSAQFFPVSTLLFVLAISLASPLNAALKAFTHETNEENLEGASTLLQHGTADNRPGHLLFVTGLHGKPNPHSVRVQYDNIANGWRIINEDNATMPAGARFNVLSVHPASKKAFLHKVAPSNRDNGKTILSHPSLDFNPNAHIIVTVQDSYAAPTGPLSVSFNGNYWVVQREDGKQLPLGTRLNILAVDEGDTESLGMTPFVAQADTHTVGIGNTKNNATKIQNIDNTAKLFITRKRTQGGKSGPEIALVYDGSTWNIVNQDLSPLTNGDTYHCVSIQQSYAASEKLDAGDLGLGWIMVKNRGAYAARFKLDFLLDNYPRTFNSSTIQPNSVMAFRVPMRAIDLKLTADITDGKTVSSPFEIHFEQIPNAQFQVTGTMASPLWEPVEKD